MQAKTITTRCLSDRALAVIKYLQTNPTHSADTAYTTVNNEHTPISRTYFDAIRKRFLSREPELFARLAASQNRLTSIATQAPQQGVVSIVRNSQPNAKTMVMQTLAAAQLLKLCSGNLASAQGLLGAVADCQTTVTVS